VPSFPTVIVTIRLTPGKSLTLCQILRLKCPPDPLAGFKGPASKGREGTGGREERRGLRNRSVNPGDIV